MTQALIRRSTGIIEAIGLWEHPPADPDLALVELTSEQRLVLQQPGTKTLNQDGTITVTPPPPPTPPAPLPDYGADVVATDDDNAQIIAAVTNLRAYLAASSPTQAATVAALKLAIRVLLFVVKRQIG